MAEILAEAIEAIAVPVTFEATVLPPAFPPSYQQYPYPLGLAGPGRWHFPLLRFAPKILEVVQKKLMKDSLPQYPVLTIEFAAESEIMSDKMRKTR